MFPRSRFVYLYTSLELLTYRAAISPGFLKQSCTFDYCSIVDVYLPTIKPDDCVHTFCDCVCRYTIKEVDDDLGNIHFLRAATRLMLKAITSSTSLLLYYLTASCVNADRDNLCIYYYISLTILYISHKCRHTNARMLLTKPLY